LPGAVVAEATTLEAVAEPEVLFTIQTLDCLKDHTLLL
jgi:hypothetical protein